MCDYYSQTAQAQALGAQVVDWRAVAGAYQQEAAQAEAKYQAVCDEMARQRGVAQAEIKRLEAEMLTWRHMVDDLRTVCSQWQRKAEEAVTPISSTYFLNTLDDERRKTAAVQTKLDAIRKAVATL